MSVITQLPVATCEAGPDSPAGVYPITISGGVAQNYEFKYKAGTLIVELNPDAIREVKNLNNGAFDIYKTDGTLVRQQTNTLQGLEKGVYVVNGKKIVVR